MLEDQEKTFFISPDANYHYTVMSFGLKNTGATYQRMMTRMFHDRIGKMVEIYIGNMVVKRQKKVEHVLNLVKVFGILRQHKLRLKADKCAFNVGSLKFLGYMIITQGIKVNLNQIKAIQ